MGGLCYDLMCIALLVSLLAQVWEKPPMVVVTVQGAPDTAILIFERVYGYTKQKHTQTPHSSASNIAGTITVAIAPMQTYTTTFVRTSTCRRRVSTTSRRHAGTGKSTRTIGIIMFYLIVLHCASLTRLFKHDGLLLHVFRRGPAPLNRALASPAPPARDAGILSHDLCDSQVEVDHTRNGAQRVRRAVHIFCRRRVVPPVRQAHGARPRKPAEQRRQQGLHARLGENTPREYGQYPRHYL